jgi:zinc protease
MRRLFALALVTLFPSGLLAQGLPPTPPPPGALEPGPFPPFQEATLPNGLRLVLVERHDQPVLSVGLSLAAGTSYDPAGKEGLAEILAGLLTKGAGTRTADQVAEAVEGVGGSLNAAAGPDFLTIQADGLSANAPLFFELIADAAMRPTFAPQELELLRRQELSSLQAERADPDAIADRFFAKGVYGEHPYGRRPSPASIAGIARQDLLAFTQARVRPFGSLLVLAGDITLADATRLATQAFGKWSGRPTAAPPPKAPPVRARSEITLVHRPGSVQSNILVGNTTFPGTDTNYFAAQVANRVLGGSADSRLFVILREQRGWTYGAFSRLDRPKGIGTFEASAEVRTEVTDSALRELLGQLRRIGAEPVPAAEMDGAKSALVGSFPLTVQTANQVASAVARIKLLGLPADYLKTYRSRLAAETPARVQAVARSAIRPAASLIVVVGDAARIYPQLKTIAPVHVISPEGTPITEAELTAKPGALNLDLKQLTARRDSFVVLANGKPVGWQTTTLRTTADGFEYEESTEIGTMLKQTSTVSFGPAGEMRKLTQDGTVQGKEVKAALTYTANRVQGFATTAGPEGPRTGMVDTTITPDVMDENVVQGLLPVFRWRPGATWTLPVFSASQNRRRTLALKVTGTEQVSLPGGSVDAYRAELTSEDQSVTYYVTTAAPHRVVRVVVAHTPLEFVITK